jgi:hypothetical protein
MYFGWGSRQYLPWLRDAAMCMENGMTAVI